MLDITSISYAIEDNKNLIYTVELFLNNFSNLEVIVLNSQIDTVMKYFPLYFNDQKPLNSLLPDIADNISSNDVNDELCVNKITTLSDIEFDLFIDNFNHNLAGHKYFKERMIKCMKNFIVLNRLKEKSVMSVFLFGSSGIGKTEVARVIASALNEKRFFVKINFQNYSSQDALNILIGSPRGYIGCEQGELSEKLQKSKVGVILCDEFEKTTRPVFSFFLELLEDGKFTDSMAREYDLDGYIIIFTSNIPTENEYKKTIPQELQTRFDLVCEFEKPSLANKTEFINLLIEKAEKRILEGSSSEKLTEKERKLIFDFDYGNIDSLRDIKRVFNDKLVSVLMNREQQE